MKFLFVWLLAIYLMNDEKPAIFDKMLNSKIFKKFSFMFECWTQCLKIDFKK